MARIGHACRVATRRGLLHPRCILVPMQTNATIAPPLRTNDLVALFGIPEATWRGWRHEDRKRPIGEPWTGPRFFKLGSIVMYDQADVQAWVEEQKASTCKGAV
jgi:hypothetical protein